LRKDTNDYIDHDLDPAAQLSGGGNHVCRDEKRLNQLTG
jgi:hypothetical protein